jgi:hypothetical protein
LVSNIHLEFPSRCLLLLDNCGGLLMGAFCLTRERVCRLQLLLVLVSVIIIGSESRGTRNHILLSQIRDSTNLEAQVSLFTSPKNRIAQLYSHTLGSIFVASYDSQGYGGGIRTRLQSGLTSGSLPHSLFISAVEAYCWLLTYSRVGPQHRKHIRCLVMDICEPNRKQLLQQRVYCIYRAVAYSLPRECVP